VTGPDFEVHVAHGGIESARIGIRNGVVRRYCPFGRWTIGLLWPAVALVCAARPSPREEKHISEIFLISGSVVAEHKDRTLGAVADDAHARPDIDGPGNAVFALRHKEDAFPMRGFNGV